jgi:3-hydroxyisobutyrate dehydrogenase-like beta-hydroxyacid dehydrogenase
MRRVAFIGLGHMGGPMCGNLVRAGFQVGAFDLDHAAVERAAALGARAARSVEDCVTEVDVLLNLLWFVQAVAVGEALTVGVRAGVSLDKLHSALVGSPANSVFLERDVRVVLDSGDYDEAFPMRLVTKDLGLAVDLARDVGLPAELTALVEQIHRRARVAVGDEAGQISAVRLYEQLAGVELRLGE